MVSAKHNPNHIMAPMSHFDANRMTPFNSNNYSFHQMQTNQAYGSAYEQGPSPFQMLYAANAQSMYSTNAPRLQTQSQWFGYQGIYQGHAYNPNPMQAPSRLNPEAAAFIPQAYQPSINSTSIPPNPYPMYRSMPYPAQPTQSTVTVSAVSSQRTNTPSNQLAHERGSGSAFSFAATMGSSSQRSIPPPPKSLEEMRAELVQTLQQRGKQPPEQSAAYRANAPPSYNANRDPRKR